MPTMYHLLQRAERIETTCAEIYAALAVQFSGLAPARSLFEALAADELQHASRIRLLAARYKHDARLVRRPAEGSTLAECVAEAEQVLAAIRAGRWEADYGRAKKKLLELEDRLSRAHAEIIARDANPDLRAFFEQLARQDAAHVRLLLES